MALRGDVDEHLTRRSVLKGLGALAAGAALSACTSTGGSKNGSASTTTNGRGLSTSTTRPRGIRRPDSLPDPTIAEGTDTLPQIEHIVVLMMENHSYDDHFGMLKRGDGFKIGADGRPLDANPYDGQLLKAFHMP